MMMFSQLSYTQAGRKLFSVGSSTRPRPIKGTRRSSCEKARQMIKHPVNSWSGAITSWQAAAAVLLAHGWKETEVGSVVGTARIRKIHKTSSARASVWSSRVLSQRA